MDKNMIHIDELVRQRLMGEEEERAGAWLRMKDLLDKNMPTGKRRGAIFGWRKIFGTAALIASIGAVSYGGYELSHRFRGAGDDAQVSSPGHKMSGIATVANNGDVASTTTTEASEANTEATATENTTIAGKVSASANNNAVANRTPVGKPGADQNKVTQNTSANNQHTNNHNSANTGNPNTAAVVVNKTRSEANNGGNTSANTNRESNNPGNSNNSAQATNRQNNNAAVAGSNSNISGIVSQPVPVKTKVEMVPMITQVHRLSVNPFTGKVTATVETGNGMAAIATKVPSEKKEPEIIAANNIVASSSFIGPTQDVYAAASDAKLSTAAAKNNKRKEANSGAFWYNARQAIKSATQHIGSMPVYTGFVGGINSTFGNYSFLGIHAGFFSEFKFSEKFDARIEGRYMHRFNGSGNSYQDNYTSYSQDPDGYYTRFANSQEFKYSTVSSLSFPVMLQYHMKNNWIFFGGANLSYLFSINPEYINRQEVVETGLSSAPGTPTPLAVSDFNSRFGVGYLFGAGYQVNPQMRIDLRINQTVWDNAKGANAQRISNDILKAPGAQVNFSYNFGAKKKNQ
jgi:hypothetical protein